MLYRKYRICQEKQYREVFSNGRKKVGKYMVIISMPNQLEWSRIGIIASKKVGKAHERNFMKRRIRSLVHENISWIRAGYDIVLIARNDLKIANYEKITIDFRNLLKKGQCYNEKNMYISN